MYKLIFMPVSEPLARILEDPGKSSRSSRRKETESYGYLMMYFDSLVRLLTVPEGTGVTVMSNTDHSDSYQVVWVHSHPVVVTSSGCLASVGPRVYGWVPDSVVRAPSGCLLDDGLDGVVPVILNFDVTFAHSHIFDICNTLFWRHIRIALGFFFPKTL